jgi:branched-chain amino acid transport system permease protein
MGNSGLVSFGHIAFMGFGAYASIWFSLTPREKNLTLPDMPEEWWLHAANLPFPLAIVAGGLVAAVVGGVIGVALVRLRGASFTIATFAMLLIVHSVALQADAFTRGSRTVIGIQRYTTVWVAVIWVVAAVIVALAFKESATGLKLRAAREDEEAAASLGVQASWVRWLGWTLSAFIAGIGGGLWAHFITSFSPSQFYLSQTFLIVAMLIIGGSGSVSGAVIGAAAVALTSELLRSTEGVLNTQRTEGTSLGQFITFQLVGFTEIVLAIAIILILIWRPSGITGGREVGIRLGRSRRS